MIRSSLAFLLFSAAAAQASLLIDNLRNGTPQTVVTYGTSLTAQATAGRWVTDLRNWLNADFPGLATVINSGMSGMASNTGVLNLSSKVLNYHPDAVIIEFSMNDAFINFGVPPNTNTTDATPPITLARAKSNLESMIADIRAQNPFAEVILMTMNPAYGSGGASRPDLASYYQVYRDVAAAQGLLLVDNYANWKAIYDGNFALFQTYVPDGVHPTAAASSAIIFPELKERLTAVPEPSTVALTAAGILAAAFAFRRRRAF